VTKLLYTAPSAETLHAEYAAPGRIDGQAAVMAARDAVIAAAVARVWALLSDPYGWGSTGC
jgi:hypothetical protein